MGEFVEFLRPDGATAPGYAAAPAGGRGAPGVVVVQEWWGLNANAKGLVDRFAAEGFHALAPDLYRGRLAKDAAEASALLQSLHFPTVAAQDLRGAASQLAKTAPGGKVGIVGFCMGGALTVIASVHVHELAAAVCFYGIPPAAAADPRQIRVPFQGHFATRDDWCTPKSVDALQAALREGEVPHTLYRYEAAHAFMNEHRPEVFDAACAAQGWSRTIDFLRQHLAPVSA